MTYRCNRHRPGLVLVLALLLVSGIFIEARAQERVPPPDQRASPLAMAFTTLDNGTYVKVTYSSPRIRHPRTGEDRQIFGELVPYGQIWRLGANEATEITTTGDINFGGQTLPAGTYTLFAIPGENTWTIIVNRQLGQWGTYGYNEHKEKDLMAIEVPASETPNIHEAFTISFEDADQGKDLAMVWEQTMVRVPIRRK